MKSHPTQRQFARSRRPRFRTVTEAGFEVDELRRAGDVVFSLAAVDGAKIAGCVVFPEMVAPFPALALGPVAVRPERQRIAGGL